MKFFISTFFIFFLFSNVFSQIKVEADFEGGNVEVLSIADSTNTITIMPALNTDKNTTRCWFYFKVYDFDKEKPLNVEIRYVNKVMAPEYPVFSYDKKTWTKIKASYVYPKKIISKKFEQDTVYFATGFPYVYSDVLSYTEKIKDNKNVKIETLCKSEGGRKVPKYTIGEGKNKDLVWIIARQHAFESMSNFVVEGFVNYMISDDSLAVEFRKKSNLHIVPMMDVDNVAIGASGRMQYPKDFNRDWNPESNWKAVKEVKKQIDETSKKNKYRVFIDIHSTFPGATYPIFCYFNMYSGLENYKNLTTYWDYYQEFAKIRPSELCETKFNKGSILADEYNSNIEPEKNGIPRFEDIEISFTHECDWNNRPDGKPWTMENLREMGRDMAKATCLYILKE